MGRIIEESSLREKLHVFQDRRHAGRMLADLIRRNVPLESALILAIPAGGVPVAYEISRRLGIPMDVIIVRKIQVPWDPEAGFGALSWDGELILNDELVKYLGLTEDEVEESIKKTRKIIQARVKLFRGDRPMPEIADKTAILVDDGLATGYTMLAAIRSVKKRKPKRIVVAVPTASANAAELISREVNDVLCPNIRSGPIYAVADAYREWRDLTDEEVVEILEKSENVKTLMRGVGFPPKITGKRLPSSVQLEVKQAKIRLDL